MSKWDSVSRSMFLVIQGWKRCQNAVAACATTTVKTVVLERFHFFYFFINLMSRGMVLGGFLVTFGDPENIFSDFRGYCNRELGRDRDRDSLGGPKSCDPSQWRVTYYSSWAVSSSFKTFWL